MKKAIAIALASAIAMPALADISVSGDARFRIGSKQVWSTGNSTKYTSQRRDQRVRLVFKGDTNNAGAYVRFEANSHSTDNADSTLDIEHPHVWFKLGDITVTGGEFDHDFSSMVGSAGREDTSALEVKYANDTFNLWARSETIGTTDAGQPGDLNDYVIFGGGLNINNISLKAAKRDTIQGTDNSVTSSDAFTFLGASATFGNITVDAENYDSDRANGDGQFIRLSADLGNFGVKVATATIGKENTYGESDVDEFAPLGEAIFGDNRSGFVGVTGAGATSNEVDYQGIAFTTTLGGFDIQIGGGSLDRGHSYASKKFSDFQASYALESGSKISFNAGESNSLSAIGVKYDISF